MLTPSSLSNLCLPGAENLGLLVVCGLSDVNFRIHVAQAVRKFRLKRHSTPIAESGSLRDNPILLRVLLEGLNVR